MKEQNYLSWVVAAAGLMLASIMASYWMPAKANLLNLFVPEHKHYLPLVASTICNQGHLTVPDDPERDRAVEDEINQVRTANDMIHLADSFKLSQAALRHSNDMADNNFFDHTGSDGTRAGDRLIDACYNWQAYGEIIAAGPSSPSSVVALWMNSEQGHDEIILNPGYKDFGAGYAYNASSEYKHYWTVDFGLLAPEPFAAPTSLNECTYHLQDAGGEMRISLYTSQPCDDFGDPMESRTGRE